MKSRLVYTITSAVVAGAILVSCGGGGNTLASNSGGIGGTGVVYGPITGFGSIFVNDLEIDIASAGITADGVDVDETALNLGMVVRVSGNFDTANLTGVATSVTYRDNLEGPIDSISSIDATNKQLVVLGQTIIVSSTTTNFANTDFASLVPGNVIEVSGLVDNAGVIRATHVERKSDSFTNGTTVIEVKGAIQNLDNTAGTFEINTLTVDYLTLGATTPQGGLSNGLFVEVKGMSIGGSGELQATSIELEDEGFGGSDSNEGDYVEIEGFVSSITSPTEFNMGAQAVQTRSSTRYEGGSAASIQVGIKLEVEGTIANGVLMADKISIEGSDNDSSSDGG